MSHSNSKIVAISTVKHLSRNYASFQQPSVQEWYSLSTSGQTQSIFKRNTADFHGDGYFLQNAGFTKGLRIAFVVCDVNSEYRRIQVNSADFEAFLPYTFIIQIHFFTHISMDIPTGILTHNYETAFLSFGIITDSNSQGYETIKMKKCHVKHFFSKFFSFFYNRKN